MLEILNVEKLGDHKFNIVRRKTKKTQILIYDSGRRFNEYVSKLKHRKFGKYDDIPHFIIDKMGRIFQIYDTNFYSKTFNETKIDKQLIKVSIENLGWLNKNPITGFFCNWIGDTYRATPYVKKWKEHVYWDRYTDEQVKSLNDLCEQLCEKHQIQKNAITSSGYIENVVNFNGVVCKSNYSDIYYDINPSFDFTQFFKNENTKNI
jgi:hypothetical protein